MNKVVVRSKIWLEVDGSALIGEGRERLLQLIDEQGSISAAARQMGLSYRKAWSYLKSMEEALDVSLVNRQRGGMGGGSTGLTSEAKDLLVFLNQLRTKFDDFSNELEMVDF